jgi:UDP-4-amino-4,6-dideoxy-N-acetyl-beta-L-altrosamine N-acetyltransferase
MNPIIFGKSVDLKIMEKSDIQIVREWRNSTDVGNFMLSRTYISVEQQETWFEMIKDNKDYLFWIILSKSGEKLGVVSLNNINTQDGTAEPGLYIALTKYRNSFYGLEAYYHILNYGFNELNLEKVWGTTISSNQAAVKMNTSFGFVVNDVLMNEMIVDEVHVDIYKLSLLKESFYQSRMVRFFQTGSSKIINK